MGVKISDLYAETAEATVQVGKKKIALTYYPMWERRYSDEDREREKGLQGRDALLFEIPRVLASWSLEDDDGQPLPVTAEAIEAAGLPTHFLFKCRDAVLEAEQLGKPRNGS